MYRLKIKVGSILRGLLLIMITAPPLISQKILMSEDFKSAKFPRIFHQDKDYFYHYKSELDFGSITNIVIKVNKNTLKVEGEHEFEVDTYAGFKGYKTIVDREIIGDEYIVFTDEFRKVGKDTVLQWLTAEKFNFSTGEKLGMDTLYTLEIYMSKKVFWGEDGMTYMSRLQQSPDIVMSPNKKKILIHKNVRPPDDKFWTEEFVLKDMDNNLIKRKTFQHENYEDGVNGTMLIDNEGSVYTIKDGQFTFFDFFQDYEPWSEPIPIANRATNGDIGRIFAQFNGKQNLVLVAPYITTDESDKNENKNDFDQEEGDTQLEGFAIWEIDGLNKEVAMQRTVMLPASFADKFLTPELADDGLRPEVHPAFPLATFEMETFKNGGMGINYEYAFNNEQYRNGKLSESRLFFAGGACEYRFEPNGNLKWAQRIPTLTLSGGGLGGYLRFEDSVGIHYLMHAHEDNFEGEQGVTMEDREILRKEKHALSMEYIMNPETGELSYKLRPELRSKGYLPIFDNSQIIKGEENSAVILFSSFRGRYRWARYDF